MLKKLRWRFITIAMIAFSSVIIALLLIINIATYTNITRQQNETLQMLIKADTDKKPPFSPVTLPMPKADRNFSPEFQYMLRFFSIYINSNNEIVKINQDNIASVSKNDAKNYAKSVLNSNKISGYYNSYRYLISDTNDGKIIIFLNSERELQLLKSLFLSTLGIALCCLTAVFIILTIFSKRAISPYIRNIETQKRFITDAGHELKTPLTAISTSADVLAMEYEDNEWIENIQNQSVRMSKLISELITLSRLDEEQPFPNISTFSLTDAVWEISEPFASLAQANNKDYIQRIEDNLMINADKDSIQQMVSILLDNAMKYSNENGKICLDVCKKKKKIEIIVFNTCPKENVPDLDRIFDRFYRADQSRNSKNSYGIGLSIAQSIAKNHGGYIKADSNDGCSITFTVKL